MTLQKFSLATQTSLFSSDCKKLTCSSIKHICSFFVSFQVLQLKNCYFQELVFWHASFLLPRKLSKFFSVILIEFWILWHMTLLLYKWLILMILKLKPHWKTGIFLSLLWTRILGMYLLFVKLYHPNPNF